MLVSPRRDCSAATFFASLLASFYFLFYLLALQSFDMNASVWEDACHFKSLLFLCMCKIIIRPCNPAMLIKQHKTEGKESPR